MTDLELEEQELRKGEVRFSSRQVETPEDLIDALKGCLPDLILLGKVRGAIDFRV